MRDSLVPICYYCGDRYSKKLSNLPRDLLFELGRYLNVRDCLKISPLFTAYYNPSTTMIQKWYKKYKKMRDIRHKILREEYEINKEIVNTTFYVHKHLTLYNLRKYDEMLNKMYGLIHYFIDTQPDNEIRKKHFKFLEYTLENKSYTNYKKFFTKVKQIAQNNIYD